MNSSPYFSIVIPTYNRADVIVKTIQSVLNQEFSDFELIIVDDGSTDDTEIQVSTVVNDKLQYHKKENAERGAARNFGANMARGEYVLFFDSDDLLYNNHLTKAKEIIDENNNPEWFGLGYDIIDGNDKIIQKSKAKLGDAGKQLIKGNFLSCNGVFVRKDIAVLNPFSEDRRLSAIEDWELWLRLASQYKMKFHNDITSVIIQHDERSVMQINKEQLILRHELFLQSLLKHGAFNEIFKSQLHKLKGSVYTYIALHLVISSQKFKKIAWKYLWKGVWFDPSYLFKRRFLAVIKNMLKR